MEIHNKHKEYHHTNTAVYSCQYHIIWCTKFRRKFLTPPIQEDLKQLIVKKAEELGTEILELETMSDYVHLLADVPPNISLEKLVQGIKGYTSYELRLKYPELKQKCSALWTRGKFISTVGAVTLEEIHKYIEEQKNV